MSSKGKEQKRKQKAGRPKSVTFLRRMAAGIAGTGVLFCPQLAADASQIESVNSDVTAVAGSAIAGGTRYDVESKRVLNGNAFNGFNNFNLTAGDVANILVPTTATTGNVLNFVRSQIQIAGIVNAVKDSKIGGNLYFLSSEGMVVSPTGKINAGSFYALTPTKDFMDKFLKENTLVAEGNDQETGYIVNRVIANQNGVIGGKGVPINSDATITVKGRVSAIDNIGLHTGKALAINTAGVKLETGVTDFSALVNTGDLPPGTITSGLVMTAGDNGNIVLTAKADQASSRDWKAWLASVSGIVDQIPIDVTADISITDAAINAKKDLSILAAVTNGTLSDAETGEYDNTQANAGMSASVNITGASALAAGGDVSIGALANNTYIQSGNNIFDIGLAVAGMFTPLDFDAEVSLLQTNATVNIDQDASVTAADKLSVTADAETNATMGAATAAAKFAGPEGLAAAVIYNDTNSAAEINIDGSLAANGAADGDNPILNVAATAKNTLNASSTATTKFDSSKVDVAFIYAAPDTTAAVNIKENAVLSSVGKAQVTANAQSSIATAAKAVTNTDDNLLAAAINLTFFNSSAALDLKGQVSSSSGDVDLAADNLITKHSVKGQGHSGLLFMIVRNPLSDLSLLASGDVTQMMAGVAGLFNFYMPPGSSAAQRSLSDTFNFGGNVVVAKGAHQALLTVNPGAGVRAPLGLASLGAQVTEKDIFFSADSSSSSYTTRKPTYYPLPPDDEGRYTIDAAVSYSDISLKAEVKLPDAKDDKIASVTGKAVRINSSALTEYNRLHNMLQEVLDAVAILKQADTDGKEKAALQDIEDAFNALKNNDKFKALGTEDLTKGESIGMFFDALTDLTAKLGNSLASLAAFAADKADVVKDAMNIVAEALDFASYNNFLNLYVASKTINSAGGTNFAVSGAVGVNKFASDSSVLIGRKSEVLADSGNLDINALSSVDMINAAGYLIPSSGAKSFGVTVAIKDFAGHATADVLEGAVLKAGGDMAVTAANVTKGTQAALITNQVSTGLAGMASVLLGKGGAGVHIDDEADLAARGIGVAASDDTRANNVAGAVVLSNNTGIGAAIVVNQFEKSAEAKIEDNDADNGGSQMDIGNAAVKAHTLEVDAKTQGTSTPYP
jgi:filamentous hemagglutinin family protein